MSVYKGTTAPSHRELVNLYQSAHNERVAAGEIRPLILPYHALGGIVLFIYLCIPHTERPWLHALRWPLAAAIVAFDLKIIAEVRSLVTGSGFGVGLVASLGIMWTLTWLVWNDPQFDAKRVERIPETHVEPTVGVVKEGNGHVVSNGKAIKAETKTNTGDGRKQRKLQNGHATNGEAKTGGAPTLKQEGNAVIKYYWQSYPKDSLRDRIDWVADLVFGLRGTGWNHEVSSNPPLPASVRAGLGEPIDLASMSLKSHSGIKRYPSRYSLFRASVPRFIIGYLILDVLKTFLPYDPYFMLGPEIASRTPLPYPIKNFPPLYLLLYREVATLAALVTALETIFRLAPLCFGLLLGPRWLGARGEPWQYPTTWGPDLSIIYEKGLAGLWGSWWHQTFRLVFAAPTNYLTRVGLLQPKSRATKLTGLLIAFLTSGFLHSSGSVTQFPQTTPLNPMLFFLLQAVGITLQSAFCQYFHAWIRKLPKDIRENANFAWTFTYLICTSPLLIDDFARGGIWLYQVVPVSPLRGLGFGEPGEGWWCWGGNGGFAGLGIRWVWGDNGRWWETGVRI